METIELAPIRPEETRDPLYLQPDYTDQQEMSQQAEATGPLSSGETQTVPTTTQVVEVKQEGRCCNIMGWSAVVMTLLALAASVIWQQLTIQTIVDEMRRFNITDSVTNSNQFEIILKAIDDHQTVNSEIMTKITETFTSQVEMKDKLKTIDDQWPPDCH